MSKIRKLYCFDKKSTKEMMSFLNNSDTYINHIMFSPLVTLHHIVPLKFKFLPESYVLKEGKEIKGLITVAPSMHRAKQMEIQKLLFEENCYDIAGDLIQYVVSRYKAMGTVSFIVRVDDYLPELVKLFISRCGFSQISYEKLWKINKIESDYNPKLFREFENSDAKQVAELNNNELLPHFRPLLGKTPKDFKDSFFKGLSYYTEYKYVMEDSKSKNLAAYISIKTGDNENYIVDICRSSWADVDMGGIIAFANNVIQKRKKTFNLFVKTKKYIQTGEGDEQDFLDRGFECVQNQIVLTNSSAKIIKDAQTSGKFTVLTQFYNGVGAINKTYIKY